MDKKTASLLIDAAMGRVECDTVIRNANIIDVFSKNTFVSDVYIINGLIAGFGEGMKAKQEIKAHISHHRNSPMRSYRWERQL